MKLTISFDSSYQATITLDGRKLTYGYDGKTGGWNYLSGLTQPERSNTIGGMVASKIASILPSILQGWMPESNEYNPKTGELWETWDKLSADAADEVAGRIDP